MLANVPAVRIAAIGLCAVLVVVLGCFQYLGSVAVRASAQPGAWVGLVPASAARRVDELDADGPLPEALRIVLARHALQRGARALAARDIARLPPSRDRFALEGELAEARHDHVAAVTAYLAAGDLADLQAAVDERSRQGDLPGALGLERAAIARLHDDRTQADALAEAYFHLGVLEQTQAYRFSSRTPQGRASESLAETEYARASALAPLSLRYLIALGNQQLNVGRIGAAERTFAHARDIDPTSAEPPAGLADAALRRGDLANARSFYANARALDPTSDAVLRLARRLGN